MKDGVTVRDRQTEDRKRQRKGRESARPRKKELATKSLRDAEKQRAESQ